MPGYKYGRKHFLIGQNLLKGLKKPKDVQELEEVSIERWADPSEWHGSLKPITRKDWLSVEIFENGVWKKVIILDETANYLSNI
ncbi:hypothetical protein [Maribacter aestuarii]|uniref:hypothetical protein n=1 Tax=Maribacter aestuarii TaxID=1130723 RepID=UPI00248C20E6|nr:hypothetical protein [Maribacter aestuarii]